MSMSTEQAEGTPPPPIQPRRKLSLGLILFIIPLLLLLIGGGFLFSTQGKRNAVPTVTVPSPSPTATTTPPTQPTPPGALFYDRFAANDHGWSLSTQAGYLRILTDNKLILSDTNPNTTLVESLPINASLDNDLIIVNFTLHQGDGNDTIGLYLRGDSNLDHDYRVDINGDGTFDIARESLDQNNQAISTMLVPPQHSSMLAPPGQPNLLTVVMLGTTLTLSLNNTVVGSVSDPEYSAGQIALFARHGATSPTVTVSFSLVEVARLVPPIDTPTPEGA